MKRIAIASMIGAGCGFAMLSPIGDALGRVPGARFIFMPAEWIFAVSRDLDLLPHGDAGFIGIPIAIILEGFLVGSVVGCALEWQHRMKGTSNNPMQPAAQRSAPTSGCP